MKNKSSITFNVIKHSWGIFIQIEATVYEIFESKNTSVEAICNNINLKFNEKIRLSTDERKMVINGFKSANINIVDQSKYLINIEQINFNYSDFQIEGLFWASKMLASDLFDQKFNTPEIYFDKKDNKYVFVE